MDITPLLQRVTRRKYIHISPDPLLVRDLKDGIKRKSLMKIEAFWFAWESQWIEQFGVENHYVYEVVIDHNRFIRLSDEPAIDKILMVLPEDLDEFKRLYIKNGKFTKETLEQITSLYGGLFFPDYNKANCWELFYNTLDVTSGSIWNISLIIDDLIPIGNLVYDYEKDEYDIKLSS